MAELPGVENVFDLKSPLFSRDFVVVDLLPGMTLVVSITCLLLSGAPGEKPNGRAFTLSLSHVTWVSLFLGLLVSVIVGVALHPFATRVRGVLSGQWTDPVWTPFAAFGRWLTKRRFARATARLSGSVKVPASEKARWCEIYRRELPDPPFFEPTRLGNAFQALRKCIANRDEEHEPINQPSDVIGPTDSEIYRAAYYDAHDRGLAITASIDDARLKIAAAERYTVVWLLIAGAAGWLLHDDDWWLLLSAAALVLSRLAYLGAVQCVVEYNHLLDDLFSGARTDSTDTSQADESADVNPGDAT